jgi:hypothetical protein
MLYVWILPLVVLPFYWLVVPGFTFLRFFAIACTPANPCTDRIGVGVPLIASAADSLGALVAMVREGKSRFSRVHHPYVGSSSD